MTMILRMKTKTQKMTTITTMILSPETMKKTTMKKMTTIMRHLPKKRKSFSTTIEKTDKTYFKNIVSKIFGDSRRRKTLLKEKKSSEKKKSWKNLKWILKKKI